jgi:hypothetical protein
MNSKLTPYERQVLGEVDAFKNPPPSGLDKMVSSIADTKVGRTVASATTAVGDLVSPISDPIARSVQKATRGVLDVLNDGASWSVRSSSILQEYRNDGHSHVTALDDIHTINIKDVDRTVGFLAAKHKSADTPSNPGRLW